MAAAGARVVPTHSAAPRGLRQRPQHSATPGPFSPEAGIAVQRAEHGLTKAEPEDVTWKRRARYVQFNSAPPYSPADCGEWLVNVSFARNRKSCTQSCSFTPTG